MCCVKKEIELIAERRGMGTVNCLKLRKRNNMVEEVLHEIQL